MLGDIVFLPLFLQVVTGESATNSGLLTVPMMAGMLTTSIASGRIITRMGVYRWWPIAGTTIAALGAFLLSTMDAQTTRPESAVFMFVLGAGLGCTMQVLILASQNAADHADLGIVTSSINFFRSLGGSFGVAIFGALFSSVFASRLGELLPSSAAERLAVIDPEELAASPAQIRSYPADIQQAVADSIGSGVQSVFLLAVPFFLVGIALAWLLPEIPLKETVHIGVSSDEEESPPLADATAK